MKKKILIILCIILSIILTTLVLLQTNNIINTTINNSEKLEEASNELIDVEIIKIENDKLNLLVTISDEAGISTLNIDEETQINCSKKTKVGFNKLAEKDVFYPIKINNKEDILKYKVEDIKPTTLKLYNKIMVEFNKKRNRRNRYK